MKWHFNTLLIDQELIILGDKEWKMLMKNTNADTADDWRLKELNKIYLK